MTKTHFFKETRYMGTQNTLFVRSGVYYALYTFVKGQKHRFQTRLGTMHQVPEIIDPVFAKTSPKRSFCMTENERFGLVFTKTGSINSGTGTN